MERTWYLIIKEVTMEDAGHYEVQCSDYNSEGNLKVLECRSQTNHILVQYSFVE